MDQGSGQDQERMHKVTQAEDYRHKPKKVIQARRKVARHPRPGAEH
jgi:hypothetical protein